MKRWGLLCCLGLCLARVSSAAPVLVQSDQVPGPGGQDSQLLAYPSNVSTGALLVIACSIFQTSFDGTTPTISDTLGSSYSVARNQAGGTGSNLSRIYLAYAVSTTSGANAVTCNPPGSSDFITLVILEYTGMTSTPLDQVASQDNTGTTITSGATPTTTQADELVVGMMTYDGVDTTITEQSPCVLIEEFEPQATAQPISVCGFTVSATGTQSATWTLGVSLDGPAAVATFKVAAVAAVVRRGAPIVFP